MVGSVRWEAVPSLGSMTTPLSSLRTWSALPYLLMCPCSRSSGFSLFETPYSDHFGGALCSFLPTFSSCFAMPQSFFNRAEGRLREVRYSGLNRWQHSLPTSQLPTLCLAHGEFGSIRLLLIFGMSQAASLLIQERQTFVQTNCCAFCLNEEARTHVSLLYMVCELPLKP